MWYTRTVPRPPIPHTDLEQVARAIASGRKQTLLAADLGWTKARVHRCLAQMRSQVAAAHGASWLDTSLKSPVEVAQTWLASQGA